MTDGQPARRTTNVFLCNNFSAIVSHSHRTETTISAFMGWGLMLLLASQRYRALLSSVAAMKLYMFRLSLLQDAFSSFPSKFESEFWELGTVVTYLGWVDLDLGCSTILPNYTAISAKFPSTQAEQGRQRNGVFSHLIPRQNGFSPPRASCPRGP